MSREKESNDYDELLSALEVWEERLAKEGPRAIEAIHLSMDDYLESKHGDPNTKEWINRGLPESEPCIDFKHQQNYK
jgi:hypothetical protein